MLKVRKPTGPIANKPMPQGSRWKTYWGKFITFRKDDRIYYVLFKYSFLRGVYDISITTSYTDDRDIIILDVYSNLAQRIVNEIDTLYANLFPKVYEKRHPRSFPPPVMYPALISSLMCRLSSASVQVYMPVPLLAVDFSLFHTSYVLPSIILLLSLVFQMAVWYLQYKRIGRN